MIRYLIAAVAVVTLTAGCDSRMPTAPSLTSVNPQVAAVPPVQPPASAPGPIAGAPLVAGSLAQGTVEAGDPVCFPSWDSTGHCRQFNVTASSDTTFRVTLKWEGPSHGLYDPELFLVPPEGDWAYADDPWPERELVFHASAGKTYRIVVIGYRLPQAFEVLVEVQ
jgi:hypothetical protein